MRTQEEVDNGMIDGAQHIDFYANTFSASLDQLDKEQTVLVYCARGGRSNKAANQNDRNGFSKVYDLNGGMEHGLHANRIPHYFDLTSLWYFYMYFPANDPNTSHTQNNTVILSSAVLFSFLFSGNHYMHQAFQQMERALSESILMRRIKS